MKNYICFFLALFSLFTYSQDVIHINKDKVLNNYLAAIGATEKTIDTISTITTKYKGQTAIGEIVIEKVTSQSQIKETYYMMGNMLVSGVVTKEECYQLTPGGEKKSLPEAQCEDFKPSVGLFTESAWLINDNLNVSETEIDGEACYVIEFKGGITIFSEIYSKETGIKVKSVSITKSNDQTIEAGQLYLDYESYNGIKFPKTQKFINFLSTGIDADFNLVEVKFNVD